MLGVVHRNNGAKEFIEFYGQVGNVRTLTAAKKLGVSAHMPNIVVAGEGDIAGATWNGGVFKFPLFKKLIWRLLAQRMKCSFAVLAIFRPKLWV